LAASQARRRVEDRSDQSAERSKADQDLYDRCYSAGPLGAKIIIVVLLGVSLAFLGGYGLFRWIADKRTYGLVLGCGSLLAAIIVVPVLILQTC